MVRPTRGGKKAMVAHDQKKRLLLVARCGEMASVAPLRVRDHCVTAEKHHVRPISNIQYLILSDIQYLHHNGETGSLVIWQQRTVLQSMIYDSHAKRAED